jgi:hypothetical protein
MSRGHGSVQRRVLDVLGDQPHGHLLPTPVLALLVYASKDEREHLLRTCSVEHLMNFLTLPGGHQHRHESQRVAVSRACHALWHAGRLGKYRLPPPYRGSGWAREKED